MLPVRRDPRPGAVTGRGLRIIDALADRWGVEPATLGKTVWFEIGCRRPDAGGPG